MGNRIGKESPEFEAYAFVKDVGFKPVRLSDYGGGQARVPRCAGLMQSFPVTGFTGWMRWPAKAAPPVITNARKCGYGSRWKLIV